MINGPDFDPNQCAFSGPVPNNTNFIVYHFDVVRKGLREFRLFQCQLGDCERMMSSLSKLFDHIRSHTKEKQYVCSHGCGKAFS